VAGCFDEETLPQDHSWDYLADFVLDINSIFHVEEYTNKIFLYHSKDDPIVPFVHLKKFSNYLPNAIVNVFEDR
jgi:predicted alpha/beta hydrolase family esterase